jgi:multiple sugar transport system permease protein
VMLKKMKAVWLYIPALLIAITTLYPILWNVTGAFKRAGTSLNGISLIPHNPTLANFKIIFATNQFTIYLWNTIVYAVIVTLIGLLIQSMAGFALARLNFPGRNLIFLLILSTMMIPFTVIMIPLFLIIKSFGWIDSMWALIVPNLVSAFGIFLIRQFYMGLPRELEEAGKIDGLSLFGVFTRIAIPLSKPILSALAIFSFLNSWNNYLWPLIVLQTKNNWVLTLGIADFTTEHAAEWNLILAGTTVGIIPTIILFFVFQKQLVEGIKMTGIK